MIVYLYGTSACHLCEMAENILMELNIGQEFQLTHVDIAENEELFAEYHLKIPVLSRSDIHLEIDWPFNPEDVLAFMSK